MTDIQINIRIRTEAEREAASRIIRKLSGAEPGTPEHDKRDMLLRAIADWDNRDSKDDGDTANGSGVVLRR